MFVNTNIKHPNTFFISEMELCLKTFKFLIKNEVFLVFLLAIFYKNGPYLTIDDLEENQKIFLDQFVLSNKNTIYSDNQKTLE